MFPNIRIFFSFYKKIGLTYYRALNPFNSGNYYMINFIRSAFFWFCNDERGKVKMLNPEYGVGDIAKELGKKWSDADPETKSKYEAMAEKDKARYERVTYLFSITSRY